MFLYIAIYVTQINYINKKRERDGETNKIEKKNTSIKFTFIIIIFLYLIIIIIIIICENY
jgi:hypothetical protein